MLREFRDFISRGNVIDLAVGIIIGATFTAIVTSLVEDLINPLLGLIVGGVDFAELSFGLGEAQFMYGNFINTVIRFVITAWVVFMLVKTVNRMRALARRRPEPPAPEPATPTTPSIEDLLIEIRDTLKSR